MALLVGPHPPRSTCSEPAPTGWVTPTVNRYGPFPVAPTVALPGGGDRCTVTTELATRFPRRSPSSRHARSRFASTDRNGWGVADERCPATSDGDSLDVAGNRAAYLTNESADDPAIVQTQALC